MAQLNNLSICTINLSTYAQVEASIPRNPERKLQPITPPNQPWKHLGIDLISDFGAENYEYKHILVTTCYLSKFVCARPLTSKRSCEVIYNLQQIFLTYGVADTMQHDQGPEFTSKVLRFIVQM